METLRLIGYWRNSEHPEYPDPRDLVDLTWDEEERHMVGRFLANGTIARPWMGLSPCRICGELNGAVDYTDGVFAWPAGLVHYVDEHGVRLPQEVVEHVSALFDEIDSSVFDLDWWLSVTHR